MQLSCIRWWSYVLLFLFTANLFAQPTDPVTFVNTMVGTAPSDAPSTSVFGTGTEVLGQTIPAVLAPFGQTCWTPQTRQTERKCVAPYYYTDSLFQGIRASHWISGSCMQDYGSCTIQLTSGQNKASVPFSHADECSAPDYYRLRLPTEHLTLELTGAAHSALLRYTIDTADTLWLCIHANSDRNEAHVDYDSVFQTVLLENPVHRLYQGRGQSAGFSVWTYVCLPSCRPLAVECDAGEIRLAYKASSGEQLELRIGTSMRSSDGARRNLWHELGTSDFQTVREGLHAAWREQFAAATLQSEDSVEQRKFYTALYHVSFHPRLMSDCDEQDYYTDFSLWDTFRHHAPLVATLWPERSAAMMRSLVQFAERRGWLPIFPCWDSYTAAMIGDHATAAICDAWQRGVRGFDIRRAYRYMRRNAFRSPRRHADYVEGKGRRALQSYLHYGYIPLEDSVPEAYHRNEQTSRTLEYAYDDYCLARLAEALGHHRDARRLYKRSQNWRNVFDPTLGYVNGRHADGTFVEGTDPNALQSFITEGAPCHYTWFVPHDIEGLVEAMGGRDVALARLDSLFTQRLYWHGNEPCHHIPYIYAALGETQKCRDIVRHIMQTEYRDTPGGLSGNDDAGQMSAWYVCAALYVDSQRLISFGEPWPSRHQRSLKIQPQ